jgi:hypothetical protein
VNGDNEQDFVNFMVVPDTDDKHYCYEAFYNATSNKALILKICPVCAGEKMKKEGEETSLLSDPSVTGLLMCSLERTINEGDQVILQHSLEKDERGVCCWMCFDCLRSLE